MRDDRTAFDRVRYCTLNEARLELERLSLYERAAMLGIESKGVLAAYMLCIASTLLCVVYGLINWNKGAEQAEPEDAKWADEEKKVEEKL